MSPKTQLIIPSKLPLLAEEAARYGSAEEFVKAQKFYQHGTSPESASRIEKNGFSLSNTESASGGNAFGTGIYLDKMEGRGASLYGKIVLDVVVSSDIKLYDLTDKNLLDLYDEKTNYGEPQKITDYLKSQGYDGIEGKNQIVIFDPEKLITKFQLTDFYGQVAKGITMKLSPTTMKKKSREKLLHKGRTK